MNSFLQECQKVYQNLVRNPEHYTKVRIILGNEACDLDSAVSALVYGYVLYHETKQRGVRNYEILPLLNILHEDLPLKTEVNYFFRFHSINTELLPTRGSRDILSLGKMNKAGVLELTLVDHHTLPVCDQDLIPSVVEVIDHRPQEPGWEWPNASVTIKKVGSCCTLIAKKIIERIPHLLSFQLSFLLYGPIVLDTFNFSQEAGRATQMDRDMVAVLDRKVAVDREKLFQDLIHAKTHVENLSDVQILRKDLKIVGGVPIAGLPMLIEEFIKRPFVEQSMTNFCKARNNVPVLLLMGVKVYGENVEKDIGVFYINALIGEQIAAALENFHEPSLLLKPKDTNLKTLKLYRQGNTKMSRKQISPIILSTSLQIKELARHV